MTTNDGGPAFPVETTSTPWAEGMSLRDWFAGQALAGLLANADASEESRAACPAAFSAAAFNYADAMIAARGAA